MTLWRPHREEATPSAPQTGRGLKSSCPSVVRYGTVTAIRIGHTHTDRNAHMGTHSQQREGGGNRGADQTLDKVVCWNNFVWGAEKPRWTRMRAEWGSNNPLVIQDVLVQISTFCFLQAKSYATKGNPHNSVSMWIMCRWWCQANHSTKSLTTGRKRPPSTITASRVQRYRVDLYTYIYVFIIFTCTNGLWHLFLLSKHHFLRLFLQVSSHLPFSI